MTGYMNKKEKIQLLEKIKQERLELAGIVTPWFATLDHDGSTWRKFISMRYYLMTGAILLAVYGIRHPSKIMKWSKQGLWAWGTVKSAQSIFHSSQPRK